MHTGKRLRSETQGRQAAEHWRVKRSLARLGGLFFLQWFTACGGNASDGIEREPQSPGPSTSPALSSAEDEEVTAGETRDAQVPPNASSPAATPAVPSSAVDPIALEPATPFPALSHLSAAQMQECWQTVEQTGYFAKPQPGAVDELVSEPGASPGGERAESLQQLEWGPWAPPSELDDCDSFRYCSGECLDLGEQSKNCLRVESAVYPERRRLYETLILDQFDLGSATVLAAYSSASDEYIPVVCHPGRISSAAISDGSLYYMAEISSGGELRAAIFRSEAAAPALIADLTGRDSIWSYPGGLIPIGSALRFAVWVPDEPPKTGSFRDVLLHRDGTLTRHGDTEIGLSFALEYQGVRYYESSEGIYRAAPNAASPELWVQATGDRFTVLGADAGSILWTQDLSLYRSVAQKEASAELLAQNMVYSTPVAGKVAVFQLSRDQSAPLKGNPVFYGVLDLQTLRATTVGATGGVTRVGLTQWSRGKWEALVRHNVLEFNESGRTHRLTLKP